jgi:hypothetical protein
MTMTTRQPPAEIGPEEPGAGASAPDLAAFYDRHDLTELPPGEPVDVEPARHPMVSHSIRFDRETMRRLRTMAAARGVGVTQLMREWILDRLAAEEGGRPREDIAAELERLARALRAGG